MSATPPKIKICGMTRLEDAELAADLGAWAIGMVFFQASPRRCSLEQAQRIAVTLRRRVELCGVFVNSSLQEIDRVVEEVGLSMIQLHGDEGPSFCAEAGRRTGARVVKAVQVADAGDIREVERFHVDFHLLDARAAGPASKLRGGTGETFDWALLGARRTHVPLILSGGLTPENVAQAVTQTHPFAVDCASGTESSPGIKDPARMRAFFDAVNEVAAHVGSAA